MRRDLHRSIVPYAKLATLLHALDALRMRLRGHVRRLAHHHGHLRITTVPVSSLTGLSDWNRMPSLLMLVRLSNIVSGSVLHISNVH